MPAGRFYPVALAVALVLGTVARAQPAAPPADAPRALSQYVHRAWTAEDGLPYTGVSAVAQDADGALWVGTRGGLARFDGARFVPFTTQTEPGLPSDAVSALWAAPDGALWVGTLGGLARYRGGRFRAWTAADGLPDDTVWDVAGGPGGAVWVGTLGGLARLQDGRFTVYTQADGLPTDDVRAVGVAPGGAVWAGTYGGGASRLAGGALRSWPLADAPAGPWVHALLAERDGVWLGVGQGQSDRSAHQLLRLEGGQIRPPRPGGLRPAPVLSSVRALLRDRRGDLWVGTYGGGVVRFRGGAAETFAAADGLSDDRVSALFEGRDGTVWVGTAGGLDALRPRSPFTTVGVAEGLPSSDVRAVMEGADGTMWAATAGGLARIDGDGVTALTVRDGLPEAFVQSLWAGRDALWLGGRHSVTRYADGAFTRYPLPAAWPEAVVRSVVEDDAGRVWLGSAGAGLVRFRPGGSRAFTEADGLAHNSVTALLAVPGGRGGRLWVGTSRGLSLFAGGAFRAFPGQERFEGVNVRSLYRDAAGTLWVGTYGRGLMRLEGGEVAVFTTRDGLHDDGAWAVLEDDAGRLWISCDRGVFRVSKAALDAVADGRAARVWSVVYGTADGLRSAEANGAAKPSGWRSADGRMWFATQRGVVVVDPARAGRPAPAPVVEGVRSGGRPAPRGAGGAVALPARSRNLTVAYTSLDLADAAGLRFRYRLDGFTDGWVEAGERREAVFTNVPAGRYSFRVAARGRDGVWTEGAAPLALSVAPFVWETAWFRLLAALGVGVAVALWVRAQARRQRAREATLEAVVAERTEALRQEKATTEAQAARLADLDRVKSRLFANVSHEFRTPLTLTLGPLDDVLADEHGAVSEPVRGQVALARRSAGRVLALVNQILDVARAESGRIELDARPLDLGAFVARLAEPFAALAAAEGVALTVERPAAPPVVAADPAHLETVLTNLLSNAVTFTPPGGAVRVSVEGSEGGARVVVADTGPGIAPDALPYVFDRFYTADDGTGRRGGAGVGIGLALAKELTELHGGTLTAESAPGDGGRFTVALPLGDAPLAQPVAAGPWAPSPLPSDGHPAPPDDLDADAPDDEDADDVTTVLVVEDHAELRAYVRRHLAGRGGYRVIEAADGAAGLALARERLPDLVVSDVMMPGLDGFALCRALKADPETDFIPVILLTARAEQADRLEGLAEHADDYLTKPFDPAELVARVGNLIAGRQRLRERFAAGDGRPAPPASGTPPEAAPVSAEAAFAARVGTAVEAGLADDTFTVERLAEAVGLSRSQLHRRLKAAAGRTPSETLRTARLARAARLLAAEAGTVSEVAYGVGFKSVAHFSNAFAAQYGCRPSAYQAEGGAVDG